MKEFKFNTYFVLYDMEDYPICYFESLEEVLKVLNYNARNLLKEFSKRGNLIRIIMNNTSYRLARFVD